MTVSTWPSSSRRPLPVPRRRSTRSGAWSGEEHGMRSAAASSGASAIGDQAPDFTLEGTEGPFTLSEHRGEIVVLLFYPGDETPVCTKQFCSYRDTGLEGLDAVVVGISAQDVDSHRRFTQHHGLTVPLL